MDSTATGFLIAILLFTLIVRLVAGSMDGDRVKRYIAEQGGELQDKSWDPFGPGWFGGNGSRIYRVRYRDKKGNTHKAHIKTSALSGVYLSGDSIVKRSEDGEPAPESLAAENARLKGRIRDLEGR